VLDVSEDTVPATHTSSPIQAKRRRGDSTGPKPKRAKLAYESAIHGDNDESDDDTSVHDFRRVQIIHKRKKRGAPLSATWTREHEEMARKVAELARKSTELHESLKTQIWKIHKDQTKELYGTHALTEAMKIMEVRSLCLLLAKAKYLSKRC
jgi:hypothetical protein